MYLNAICFTVNDRINKALTRFVQGVDHVLLVWQDIESKISKCVEVIK